MALSNIFRCIKPDIKPEKLEELSKKLIEIYRTDECYTHIDGGQELVDKVRATNKIVGVISNSDPSLKYLLKNFNLAQKFDFIITSHDVGFQKPNKEIFQYCLKKYNIESHEALHIGNMYCKDYVGARNAGWSSLLISTNANHLEKCQPTQGYNSIKELIKALDNKEIRW